MAALLIENHRALPWMTVHRGSVRPGTNVDGCASLDIHRSAWEEERLRGRQEGCSVAKGDVSHTRTVAECAVCAVVGETAASGDPDVLGSPLGSDRIGLIRERAIAVKRLVNHARTPGFPGDELAHPVNVVGVHADDCALLIGKLARIDQTVYACSVECLIGCELQDAVLLDRPDGTGRTLCSNAIGVIDEEPSRSLDGHIAIERRNRSGEVRQRAGVQCSAALDEDARICRRRGTSTERALLVRLHERSATEGKCQIARQVHRRVFVQIQLSDDVGGDWSPGVIDNRRRDSIAGPAERHDG